MPTKPRGSQVSIDRVAKRAGVSIATVSRIVNRVPNKASAETIERVTRAISELGYRPGSVGRALRKQESRLVALLPANLGNPAMAAITASAEAALRREGWVMLLCDTHDDAAIQDEHLLEMRAQLARATVLLGVVPSAQLGALHAAEEPLLFVNRRSPERPEAPFIGIDNAAAGRDVADFFAREDIADVGVIHGPLASSATADRVAAFRRRMMENGAPLSAERVVTEADAEHLEIGWRGMERLLALTPRPRGLFCLSDLIAYGAARRAREVGLDAPRDLLIVGFDDNPLNDWLAPWLTSVRVPYGEYGPAVVEALKALWSGEPRSIILGHELIVRR